MGGYKRRGVTRWDRARGACWFQGFPGLRVVFPRMTPWLHPGEEAFRSRYKRVCLWDMCGVKEDEDIEESLGFRKSKLPCYLSTFLTGTVAKGPALPRKLGTL